MPMTITLDPEVEKRLESLAEMTGRDKSVILRMAIENGIEEIADYFTASDTLERVRNGEEKTYSSEEVRMELGLDD